MKSYPGQKAQQALRELLKDAPLEQRLKDAWVHLSIADNDHQVEDSLAVKEAYAEMEQAFDSGSLEDKARAVGDVIESIFAECGFNDSVEQDS